MSLTYVILTRDIDLGSTKWTIPFMYKSYRCVIRTTPGLTPRPVCTKL